MKLFINQESKIEDICKSFTASYPFLKIELYKKPFAGSFKKERLPFKQPLGQIINHDLKATIVITAGTTVAELEESFSSIGLQAEIFRRSGNVWVETSLTNNWSLYQQNCEGEEISRHFQSQ
ncbi:hypothetical protein [Parafilimonas sp.]|uniref:hypothetical protein n=1 Tax=Parafilimonas sp. TaxID=1969739 RepID=UPI0039E3A0AA